MRITRNEGGVRAHLALEPHHLVARISKHADRRHYKLVLCRADHRIEHGSGLCVGINKLFYLLALFAQSDLTFKTRLTPTEHVALYY